jgi:hypothetical protein
VLKWWSTRKTWNRSVALLDHRFEIALRAIRSGDLALQLVQTGAQSAVAVMIIASAVIAAIVALVLWLRPWINKDDEIDD